MRPINKRPSLPEMRYESPCGVMSACKLIDKPVAETLRIPMRGYEKYRLAHAVFVKFSYESPCGVMSWLVRFRRGVPAQLRIPMRGYEESVFSFIIPLCPRYESPCGVMS